MKRAAIVIIVSHRTNPINPSNHRRLAVTEREDAPERNRPTGKGSGESHVLMHERCRSRGREARDHKGRNRESVDRRVAWKDRASTSDVKQYRTASNNRDVSNKPEVTGRRILEQNGTLALDQETSYVEGSKVERRPHVGLKVPSPRKIVQPCWNIHDELAVDEDLELSNPIVKVVQVEAIEGQQHCTAV